MIANFIARRGAKILAALAVVGGLVCFSATPTTAAAVAFAAKPPTMAFVRPIVPSVIPRLQGLASGDTLGINAGRLFSGDDLASRLLNKEKSGTGIRGRLDAWESRAGPDSIDLWGEIRKGTSLPKGWQFKWPGVYYKSTDPAVAIVGAFGGLAPSTFLGPESGGAWTDATPIPYAPPTPAWYEAWRLHDPNAPFSIENSFEWSVAVGLKKYISDRPELARVGLEAWRFRRPPELNQIYQLLKTFTVDLPEKVELGLLLDDDLFETPIAAMKEAWGGRAVTQVPVGTAIDQYLARVEGGTLIVVGHVEGESFVVQNRAGVAVASVSIPSLIEKAAKHHVLLVPLGCRTAAAGVPFGFIKNINTDQVVRFLQELPRVGMTVADIFSGLGRIAEVHADVSGVLNMFEFAVVEPATTEPITRVKVEDRTGIAVVVPPSLADVGGSIGSWTSMSGGFNGSSGTEGGSGGTGGGPGSGGGQNSAGPAGGSAVPGGSAGGSIGWSTTTLKEFVVDVEREAEAALPLWAKLWRFLSSLPWELLGVAGASMGVGALFARRRLLRAQWVYRTRSTIPARAINAICAIAMLTSAALCAGGIARALVIVPQLALGVVVLGALVYGWRQAATQPAK